MRRIGIDTGGTFTDCVLTDEDGGMTVAKVPSQPANPEKAILHGIAKLLEQAGIAARSVDFVGHGTTIATNAVITGQYARSGFIATRGCRDVIEIGTQRRPKLYDLHQNEPVQIITRDLRVEVPGRLAAEGNEIEALEKDAIRVAVRRLLAEAVESVAVGGLFSFVNPAHERAIAAIVREEGSDVYVVCSADISSEAREYPRFATAAVNATLAPLLDPYIRKLEESLAAKSLECPLFIMQSNGGVGTARRLVGEKVHQLVLSGPAGGVIGAIEVARSSGSHNLIALDVGGTSADIGVVVDGQPRMRLEMPLPNGMPLHIHNLEIETIGAGGGSIAWVDPGGALKVGPMSAGADPGPACYGTGGTLPTVTDAQVLLRRLNPASLLGGELKVDREAAVRALTPLARQLGLSLERTAAGIIAVMEANMAGAIRRSAARHGDDLRDFALVAAGGAGALSAAALARTLDIPKVIVPPRPGLLSAMGLLAADLRHDISAPILMFADAPDRATIDRVQEELEQRALETLAADGVPPGQRRCDHSIDMRYLGQDYTVTLPTRRAERVADIVARFHAAHERIYGHSSPRDRVELVTARAVGWGILAATQAFQEPKTRAGDAPGLRDVWFEAGEAYVSCPIHMRDGLIAGAVIMGPAIIEQLDSTTVMPPGYRAVLDASDNLILSAEAQS